MKYIRFLSFLVIFVLFGLAGGWVFNQFEYAGTFADWKQAPTLKDPNFELIGVFEKRAYIIDHQQILLVCEIDEPFCFEPEFIWDDMAHPCNFSSPAFLIIANPPENIDSCVQNEAVYADAIGNSVAIKDKDGNLWVWHHMQGGFLGDEVRLIKNLCLGVLTSLMLSIFVLVWRRKKKQV